MRVRIVCPELLAFEGDAAFVALPSTTGEVGVLDHHASEICTITSGYVRIADTTPGTVEHLFAVSGGYAQITGDEVIILAERAGDVDAADAQKLHERLADFEDQLSNLSEDDARRAYLYNEIAWCELMLAKK